MISFYPLLTIPFLRGCQHKIKRTHKCIFRKKKSVVHIFESQFVDLTWLFILKLSRRKWFLLQTSRVYHPQTLKVAQCNIRRYFRKSRSAAACRGIFSNKPTNNDSYECDNIEYVRKTLFFPLKHGFWAEKRRKIGISLFVKRCQRYDCMELIFEPYSEVIKQLIWSGLLRKASQFVPKDAYLDHFSRAFVLALRSDFPFFPVLMRSLKVARKNR